MVHGVLLGLDYAFINVSTNKLIELNQIKPQYTCVNPESASMVSYLH